MTFNNMYLEVLVEEIKTHSVKRGNKKKIEVKLGENVKKN